MTRGNVVQAEENLGYVSADTPTQDVVGEDWRSRWPRAGHETCPLCAIVLRDAPDLAADLVDFFG
jgi:hypothetical protein